MFRIPSRTAAVVGLALIGAACNAAETEGEPRGDAEREEETAIRRIQRPGCGPSTRYWRQAELTGPNHPITIPLPDGSFLRIAAGVVPSGQTYTYRLEEDPTDNGVIIGTMTPADAPIIRPADGSEPYVLNINHQPCGNREFSGIYWEEGGQFYGASDKRRGQYVQAPMPRFGSTYLAASPVLFGVPADTTGADTVGLAGEMGTLPQ